jgi:BMFP domain-containing protein YqiC
LHLVTTQTATRAARAVHHIRAAIPAAAHRWGAVRPAFTAPRIVGPKPPVERLGHAHRRLRRNVMLNSKTLDDLAAKIGKAFEGSPAKDIEKNVKAMLQSGLSRLDLVTRAEFDVQAEVLRKTRDKVERLEARVAELEARMPPPQAPA